MSLLNLRHCCRFSAGQNNQYIKIPCMRHIISIIVMVLMTSCYEKRAPMRMDLEGQRLPSFDIQLIDSTTYLNTASIPTGKPFALLYFSPYCPYCKAQMEEIVKDMDRLKDIQFYLLTGFRISDMKQFSEEYKLSKYPNVIVARDTSQFFAQYFAIPGVPYTAIYGKDKKLHKSFAGKVLGRQLKAVAGN